MLGGCHGLVHVRQKLAAKRRVLVHDGQVVHAHGHQLLRQALGFVGVAGAHVEHRAVLGLAQRRGAALRGHVGDLCLVHQGHDALVVGRAHARDKRHHIGIGNQLAHVVFRAGGVIAVVHCQQLDLAAVDALGIGLRKAGVQSLLEFLAQAGQRTAGTQRAANGHHLGVHGVLHTHGAGRSGQQQAGAGGHKGLGELATLHGKNSQTKSNQPRVGAGGDGQTGGR
ncbi:hypothetical protein D3C71_1393860 [compost metagenome]